MCVCGGGRVLFQQSSAHIFINRRTSTHAINRKKSEALAAAGGATGAVAVETESINIYVIPGQDKCTAGIEGVLQESCKIIRRALKRSKICILCVERRL